MKTIEEKNRMIAEFMGVDQVDVDTYIETSSELKYHTSWDWLMPVVDKIKSLSTQRGMLDKLNLKRVEIFKRVTIFSSLDDVYDYVYEFIEWYNENK